VDRAGNLNGVTYHSLYRRFRPQRFEDVLGQDHISATLRNAVRTGKVAHAYLFSGPRGCGKTTSARILAKALNCTDLQDGEPCGVCESCVLVTSGASMDVNELDAASNNGVDAMRDLVARASLGMSGRRKVYIIDEVHMLSTAASNALLKTLEEPPDHVVFVLATTDPQKVLETIRSRTQHFQFRLFPMPTLIGLLRKVSDEAQLDVDDATIEAVARKGNGSARDALSALDQVVASGGIEDSFDISEIVRALGNRSAGDLLVAVDRAVNRGRDPRQLARDISESLREIFLAHMGLPRQLVDPDLERLLSPASVTRALESLGEVLIAMRDAIDPRVLLETMLVRLVRPDLDASPAALVERLDRLERMIASGSVPTAASAAPTAASQAPSAQAPTTRPSAAAPVATAPSVASPEVASPAAPPAPAATPVATAPRPAPSHPSGPSTGPASVLASAPTSSLPSLTELPSLETLSGASTAPETKARTSGIADAARQNLARGAAAAESAPRFVAAPETAAAKSPKHVEEAPEPEVEPEPATDLKSRLIAALEKQDRKAKALLIAGRFLSEDGDELVYAVPNAMHLERCREYAPVLNEVTARLLERSVRVELAVDADGMSGIVADPGATAATVMGTRRHLSVAPAPVEELPSQPQADDEVDLTELIDANDVNAPTMLSELTKAFPGAEIVEEKPVI
jgi:DNA polymerase III subunit gamma/tau